MYGVQLPTTLNIGITSPITRSFSTCISASEALRFAALASKARYDKSHKPLAFHKGDKVLLKLHTGYSVQSTLGRKLGNQYTGPFKILDRIGPLAYKLDFPEDWKIHPVISIAHLENYFDDDPFGRQPEQPGPVNVDSNETTALEEQFPSWELEKILDKREIQVKRGRSKGIKHIEYLVKWLGWGDEWNQWMNVDLLSNAKDLVKDFELARQRK